MNCYLFATRTWKSTWKAQSRQICISTDKEPSNKQTNKQTNKQKQKQMTKNRQKNGIYLNILSNENMKV